MWPLGSYYLCNLLEVDKRILTIPLLRPFCRPQSLALQEPQSTYCSPQARAVPYSVSHKNDGKDARCARCVGEALKASSSSAM